MPVGFDVDEVTLQAISDMKSFYGVQTNAQVIRKALALARVANDHAHRVGDNWELHIKGPDGNITPVILNG